MFEQIKKDRDSARKARDQFTLTTLSTLIGEVETKHRSGDKDFADINKAVQKVVKSSIEACQEMYKVKQDEKSLKEIEILEQYIVKGMSNAAIELILKENSFTELKDVMQHFKKLNAPVDMKLVREMFMEMSK